MKDKMSVWAWHSDAPHGGYLFHGNPNPGMPPFHIGGLENLICGEWLVWEHTRRALEMDMSIAEWNHHQRTMSMKMRPKLITIELRLADAVTRSRRKRKEGGAE